MFARESYLLDPRSVKKLLHQAKHFFNHEKIKSLNQLIMQLTGIAAEELSHQELELLTMHVSTLHSLITFAQFYVEFVKFNQTDDAHVLTQNLKSLMSDIKDLKQLVDTIQSLAQSIDESRNLLALMPTAAQIEERKLAEAKLKAIARSHYHFLLEPVIPGAAIQNASLIKANKDIKKLKLHLYDEITSMISTELLYEAMQLILKQEVIAFDNDQFAQTIKGVEIIKKDCAEWARNNHTFALYARCVFNLLAEIDGFMLKRFKLEKELGVAAITAAFAEGITKLNQVTPNNAKCHDERVMVLFHLLNAQSLMSRFQLRIDQITKRNKTTLFDAERLVIQLTGLDQDIKELTDMIADLTGEKENHDKAATLYRTSRDYIGKLRLINLDKIASLLINLKLALPDVHSNDEAKHIQQLLMKLSAIHSYAAPEMVAKLHKQIIAARKQITTKFPHVTKESRPAMYRFYSQANLHETANNSVPQTEKDPSSSGVLTSSATHHSKKK